MNFKLHTLFAILLLSGCSLLSPVKVTPAQSYLLKDPVLSNSTNVRTAGKTILVTKPTAPAWLNSQQMVYELKPAQINYFGENQWASQPAELLQPLIVHALQQSGLYRAVISAPSTSSTDQRMDIRLVQMQQQFFQKPSVYVITLQIQLINGVTGEAIAASRFSANVVAPTDNPAGGAIAADEAVAKLLPQIINFCRRYA